MKTAIIIPEMNQNDIQTENCWCFFKIQCGIFQNSISKLGLSAERKKTNGPDLAPYHMTCSLWWLILATASKWCLLTRLCNGKH